jgi:amino acid adenylation domain-containing protein
MNTTAPNNDFDPFADMQIDQKIEQVTDSTEAQREIWLACSLSQEASLAYNEAIQLNFSGSLNSAALESSLNELIQRHQSLRATFSEDGLQFIVNLAAPIALTTLTESAQAQALQMVSTPFDLQNGPLFKATLVKVQEQQHVLILCAHHIVCDGWSFGVIVTELAALYNVATAASAKKPPTALPYTDYANQELQYRKTTEFSADQNWWVKQYDQGAPVLDLPFDQPRSALRTFDSKRFDVQIETQLAAQLTQYARTEGVTLFSLLLAGFAALMQRLTSQDELVIGVPAAGQAATEMTQLVGHCVNLLPIRIKPDSQSSIVQYVKQTQTALLDAFEHQRFTFGTLLQSLQLKRDPSRSTLVSLMFNVDQALEESQFRFAGLSTKLSSVARVFENFEYFLNIVPVGATFQLECQYNSKLYTEQTIKQWLDSYQALLSDMVSSRQNPLALGQLEILNQRQKSQLMQWSRNDQPAIRSVDLDHILRQHFEQSPSDLAVIAGRARLTYGQLQDRAAQLARAMIAQDVGPGKLVGVCMPRNADMVVAVYAVLMTGAAYVPLDPNFPPARLAYMVQDSQLTLVVSDTARIQILPATTPRILFDADSAMLASLSTSRPVVKANDQDAAYVLYTSGSTGQPKGVAVPRNGLKNILLSMAGQTQLARQDRLLAVTTLSFDISLIEVFMPLVCGATVVVATREQVVDGKALMDLIESEKINFLQATPSGWRVLFEAGWQGGVAGFKGLVGGESLTAELALRMTAACSQVWNGYGPTETSIYSTCWPVDGIRDVPPTQIAIGKPVANTTIDIRDAFGNLCAIGARGELCIGGDGLALGYLNRAELTAEKFISDANGQRYYRTGDLARWRSDGLIEHLGRMDTQVKLRGYRIELGEIESSLVKQRNIADAVAIVREDQPGDQRLVAYVIAKPGMSVQPDQAREELKASLPRYMLPASIVLLDAIPRLPNTKVDRNSLPAPASGAESDKSHEHSAAQEALLTSPPTRILANELARAMGKILGAVDMGLHQDFFAMGGHSLTAAQFATRVNRLLADSLPSKLSLRHVFEAPTPAGLANLLFAEQPKAGEVVIQLRPRADRKTAPLSLVQRRLWGLEQLNPGRSLYNTPSAHRLRGEINLPALQRAFEAVIARQDVLRTVVTFEGSEPIQTILDSVPLTLVDPIDLSGIPSAQREKQLLAQMQVLIDTPISMTQAPLFVAKIFKMAEQEHVLFFMTHHFIWDGWSFDLFYDEISTAYVAQLDGNASAPAALEITYGDYSAWQVQWLESAAYKKQISYWREKLAHNHEIKALNTDFPRRASMSGRGATEWITLNRDTVNGLRLVAKSADVTLFTVLLAIFSVLLRTLGSSARQSIGIPVRGRNGPETEPVMGYFTNLLPLILKHEPQANFLQLLAHAKSELVGAFASPDVAMEELTSALQGSARSQPLYLALFSFQDVRNRPLDWGNLKHERIEVAQKGATEDFGLWFVENDTALVGGLTYNTDLYRLETARNLHKRLQELMVRVANEPTISIQTLTSAYGSAASDTIDSVAPGLGAQLATIAPAAVPKDPPQTSTEKTLAVIWTELLQIQGIERSDNFFDLGGNSLLAMQAIAEAQKQLGRSVDARRYVMESLMQLSQGYDDAKDQVSNSTGEKKGFLSRLFGGARGPS